MGNLFRNSIYVVTVHIQPMKMEQIECYETLA